MAKRDPNILTKRERAITISILIENGERHQIMIYVSILESVLKDV